MTTDEMINKLGMAYLQGIVYVRKHPDNEEAAATLAQIQRIIDADGSRNEVIDLTIKLAALTSE